MYEPGTISFQVRAKRDRHSIPIGKGVGVCRSSQVVEERKKNSKQHLSYSQNDGHLHLVGVGEDQFVICCLPHLDREKIEL